MTARGRYVFLSFPLCSRTVFSPRIRGTDSPKTTSVSEIGANQTWSSSSRPAQSRVGIVGVAIDSFVVDSRVPTVASIHGSGRYFSGQSPTTPAPAARDRAAAERLWHRSAELLGMDVPLSDAVSGSAATDAS